MFFHGEGASQQTQNICITFIQRRPNVIDVDPTLYKVNVIQMFCVCWDIFIHKQFLKPINPDQQLDKVSMNRNKAQKTLALV